MNEQDRKTPTTTWPPPGIGPEQGNSDPTRIATVPPELLQRLFDSGAAAIDDPADDEDRVG